MECAVLLTIRNCKQPNEVDLIGECEGNYMPLPLYGFACTVIEKAKFHGGEMIPWVKEPELNKFCYSFRFAEEKGKKAFIEEVSKLTE